MRMHLTCLNVMLDRTSRLPLIANFLTVLSLVAALGRPMPFSKGGQQQLPTLENDVLPIIPFSGVNVTFDQLQRLRIDVIKQEILNKLGMTDIPDVRNVQTTVQERREILRLYKKSVEELQGRTHSVFDEQQFSANQFDSFTDSGAFPAHVDGRIWESFGKLRTYFAVDIAEPSDPYKETIVTSATLKLYKAAVYPERLLETNTVDSSLRIDVYQIIDINNSTGQTLRRLVDSRLMSIERTGWEEFNVGRAVQDWIRDPTTNLGLEIDSAHGLSQYVKIVTGIAARATDPEVGHIDTNEVIQLRPPGPTDSLAVGSSPTLSVLTHQRPILGSGSMRRSSRTAERENCQQGDGETRCCRYPLTISFRDIGWSSWIVQPESYEAYYCSGSCPAGYRIAHTFATIKSLLTSINQNSVLALACTATRMSGLNIAHYNQEGRLVVSVLENMFPAECMCA